MAKIEVFTAGTYLCADTVNQVKKLACSKCEIVVYDLNQFNATAESKDIAKLYGVQSIPSVVMNGKMISAETIQKAKAKGLSNVVQHD